MKTARLALHRLASSRLGLAARRLMATRVGAFLCRHTLNFVRSKATSAVFAGFLGVDLLIDPDGTWRSVHNQRLLHTAVFIALLALDVVQMIRQRGDGGGWDYYDEYGPDPDDGPGGGGLQEPVGDWDIRELLSESSGQVPKGDAS